MKLYDQRGLSVTSERPSSVDHYEEALALLHGYYGDPLAVVERALSEEPDFLMGLALKAGALVASSERRAEPALRATVEAAERLIGLGRGNDRERAHFAAARAWLEGDFATATDRYNRLVAGYPRDALAVQVAHLCNFYLGRSPWLRDHVAWALPHYHAGEFSYSYLLGMHAFGLEEANEFARAEAAGMAALNANPRDPWAIHALAHVYEVRGDAALGIDLYEERLGDWADDNFFAIHNWWHLSLYYLEVGERDHVLRLYDERVRAGRSEVNLDLVDASAMLWRLDANSVDVGSRWQELSDAWNGVEEEQYYAFNDWHALMAYLGAGHHERVERVLDGLERAARGRGTNAILSRDVGLPCCRGFTAFARGDYQTAIDELFGVRAIAHRFGGSNAQRDIIDWTLIEAATRAGDVGLAKSLVTARRAQKPRAASPFRMLGKIERMSNQTPDSQTRAA